MLNKIKKQDGVSLYLAVIILAVLLAISLGLSSILISQIKIIRGMEESVIAFYAADTGIEIELYQQNLPPFSYSGSLGDATYFVVGVVRGVDGCDAPRFCIKSKGVFGKTQRAIEVKY